MSQSGPRSGHWVMAAQPSDEWSVRCHHGEPRCQSAADQSQAATVLTWPALHQWGAGLARRSVNQGCAGRLEISGPGSGLSLVTTITHQAPHRATRAGRWHAAWIIYCCASDVRVMKNAKLKQQWKYWCAILSLFGFILSYCNVRVLSQSAGCRIVIPCLEPQWINHHSHPATATSPA